MTTTERICPFCGRRVSSDGHVACVEELMRRLIRAQSELRELRENIAKLLDE